MLRRNFMIRALLTTLFPFDMGERSESAQRPPSTIPEGFPIDLRGSKDSCTVTRLHYCYHAQRVLLRQQFKGVYPEGDLCHLDELLRRLHLPSREILTDIVQEKRFADCSFMGGQLQVHRFRRDGTVTHFGANLVFDIPEADFLPFMEHLKSLNYRIGGTLEL